MVPFGQKNAQVILDGLEGYKHFRTIRTQLGFLGGAVKVDGQEDKTSITIQDVLSYLNALYSVGDETAARKLAKRLKKFKPNKTNNVLFSTSLESRLLSRHTSFSSSDLSHIEGCVQLKEPYTVKHVDEIVHSEDNAVWISMLTQLGNVDDALAVYESLKNNLLYKQDDGLLYHKLNLRWLQGEFKFFNIERHYICSTENILWALALDDLFKATGEQKYKDEAYDVIQAMKSTYGFQGYPLITDEGFVRFGIVLADVSNSVIMPQENLTSADHLYSKNLYLWVGALSRFEDLKREAEQSLLMFEDTPIINRDGVVYHLLRKEQRPDQTIYTSDQGIRARALLSLGHEQKASEALDATYRLNGLLRTDGQLGRKTARDHDVTDKRLYIRDVCDLAVAVSGRSL